MKKLSITIAGVLLGAGWCLAAYAADAAAPVKGTWSLNNWTPGDTAHLTVAYRNATTRWEWGNDQPLEDLHGLTSEQRHSAHASVSFTMDRDAGTFAFEGTLTLGLGRGDFRFVPNPTYATKLGVLGYETIGEDELLGLALRDVSLAFATEVKSSGLKDVTVSDLLRLKDHGIDGEFVRALRSPGAPVLSADDIIKLHDHGVKPEYVARVQSAGYPDLTVDQIIKLHDHGVD